MTIAITSSGISLDGPLVAGEKVAVSVSGLSLAAEDKPTLALLARFPDALLASVELTESDTPGTWTGELDTATKQTALFFATARADERRDAALELVSGRVSLARLTVPMANSALCPKPDGSPFASPVYVPVPGPPGTCGDPYDQAPEMDGEASPGTVDEYARGDHRHPTDESRASTEDATLYAASFGDWVASGLPVGFHVGQTSWSAGNWSIEIVNSTGTPVSTTVLVAGEETATTLSAPHTPLPTEPTTYADLTFSRSPSSYVLGTQADKPLAPTIPDLAAIRSGAAAGATAVQPSALATVATSGSYNDLTNKPTIPGPAPVTSVNGDTGDVLLYGNTLVMSSSDSTLVSEAINAAQSDATTALSDISAKATATAIAPAFSTSSTYAVGDYVTYEGLLYKCTTAVSTAGAWNAANWTAVSAMAEMPAPVSVPNRKVWAAIGSYTSNTALKATTASGDFTLSDGAIVIMNCPIDNGAGSPTLNVDGTGAKYIIDMRAGNSASTIPAGAMKSGGIYVLQCYLKSSQWTWVLQGTFYAPLASPAFTGTPTAPTANAGTNTTQIATTAFVQDAVRYALASKTPTVSGTSATVACEDRAINGFTVATGITSLTITPPAAVTGRARDFFCRVTLTDSSLPTVTLSGATIDIGATEVAGMTQGVNLLMFTEISSGHWLASRRSAS